MKNPSRSTSKRAKTPHKSVREKKGNETGVGNRQQLQDNAKSNHDAPKASNAPSAEFFSRAHVENHGSFINNVIFQNRDGLDVDLKLLLPLVVVDAMHTGKVRADPLRCDPNTRQAIHLDIISWIESECLEKGILWILGPAGIGKSAIAMTTAEKLDHRDSKAKLAASFFFFSSDTQRNDIHYLVPTLAYQLAIWMQEVGREVERVIKRNPKILEATVEAQWKALIVEPVNSVSGLPPSVIIIDGLDECGSAKEQRRILDLISSCGSNFPLAFLITSRPEPPIVNAFNSEPLSSLCRPHIDLSQHKDYREMYNFIQSNFSKIYSRHQDILQSYSKCGTWPSDDVIDLITSRADGQYIYPVTIFKYIDDDDSIPHEKLQACLEQVPEASSPLDILYLQVLRSSHKPDNIRLQDLLFLTSFTTTSIPALSNPPRIQFHFPEATFRRITKARISTELSMKAVVLFLFSDSDNVQCRFALRKLHSVLSIPKDEESGVITIHHKSFMDFLFDHRRSGSYYIGKIARASEVIKQCLTKLEQPMNTHSAKFFQALLHIWWRCSAYLLCITDNLSLLLESFDFDPCLERMLECGYNIGLQEDFVESCNTWKRPSLIAKFGNAAFGYATYAAWLRRYYSCMWQGCDHYWNEICPNYIYHNGECPLTWNTLLALSKIYVRYRIGATKLNPEVVGLWIMTTDASHVVLPSLAMLTSPGMLRGLPEKDARYLHCWSRPWAICNGEDRFREDEEEWEDELRNIILSLIQQLPKEHHYHELNGANVLLWLKVNLKDFSDSRVASEVLAHWEGGDCNSPEMTMLEAL
ncbi:hypothetical protein AX16_003025 [Volvariella volvacea WC 439]|nr:hypothetical protein AX16_003025 [Volvariella volvacea WC 439]